MPRCPKSRRTNYRKRPTPTYESTTSSSFSRYPTRPNPQDLCTSLSFHQPQNVNKFLVEQLTLKKDKGLKTGLFASEEITNIFKLFDLKKEGYINK